MNSSRLHPRAQRGATALARSPRTAALTIVMLAVATLAALLLPASPGNAADLKFSGTLTKNSKTATHAVTAPKGTLAATLTFSGSTGISATLTLRDSRGDVVTRGSGQSPVSLSQSVPAGTYRLEVTTSWPLTQKNMTYQLAVKTTAATVALRSARQSDGERTTSSRGSRHITAFAA